MQGAIITVPMAAYGNQSDYIMLIGGSFLVEGKEVPCRLLLAPDVRSLNYLLNKLGTVSYTHLDVYKRQARPHHQDGELYRRTAVKG